MLFVLLFALLASALCSGPCDVEQFVRTKFDDIKTDPFSKVIIISGDDKVENICKLLDDYSLFISRAFGIVTYIIDPTAESEENLQTLHYEGNEPFVFVQSQDSVALKFNGELDPTKEDPEIIRNNLDDFIEIRLAMPGTNLLLEWPVDGLEGVVDGGIDEIPALIGVYTTERQSNFIERMATRNKGAMRVYKFDCNSTETLTSEQQELCKYSPALLFVDHYEKYSSEIRIYKLTLGDTFDELDTSRWIDREKLGKHTDEYIKLSPENVSENIKGCIPHCGEHQTSATQPLDIAPKTLAAMVKELGKRVDRINQ